MLFGKRMLDVYRSQRSSRLPFDRPRIIIALKSRTGREGTMPTYEYRCESCGENFERRESITEHEIAEPKCPKCGSGKVARAVSAFYAKTSKKS